MHRGRAAVRGRDRIYLCALARARSPKSLAALAPGTPKELVRLVERCLSKDPGRRPESAAAVARELRQIAETSVAPTAHTLRAASLRKSRNRWAQVAVASLVAAGAIAIVFVLRRGVTQGGELEFRQESLVTWPSDERYSAVSPDGRWVSFASNRDGRFELFAQPVDGNQARKVAVPPGEIVNSHVWSPDGSQFALAMTRSSAVFLDVVPAPFGGAPVRSFEIPAADKSVLCSAGLGTRFTSGQASGPLIDRAALFFGARISRRRRSMRSAPYGGSQSGTCRAPSLINSTLLPTAGESCSGRRRSSKRISGQSAWTVPIHGV